MRQNKRALSGASIAPLILDLLFPRRCPVCDRPVRPFGALICPECERTLHRISADVCPKCGREVFGRHAHSCPDCVRTRHVYDRGCAVFTYRSAAAALYRFKYHHRAEYAQYFGLRMAERMEEVYDMRRLRREKALIIPVPASADRVRQRGYDQAVLLAKTISEQTGLPVAENVLVRTGNTAAMKGIRGRERYKNLKNAFIVHGNDVRFRMIMLIDDIYTTGATMDACAAALRRAGASAVYGVCLAIGESYYDE